MMANSPTNVQDSLELHPDAAREWRCARYEEMGFSASEALALATSTQAEYTGAGTEKDPKKEWRQPLSWQKVKTALDNGCSPTLALEIFITKEGC